MGALRKPPGLLQSSEAEAVPLGPIVATSRTLDQVPCMRGFFGGFWMVVGGFGVLGGFWGFEGFGVEGFKGFRGVGVQGVFGGLVGFWV